MTPEQQEQKRIFEKMFHQASQLQNVDPAGALQIFEQMRVQFPQADGVEPWIVYLRKLLQRSQSEAPKTTEQEPVSQVQEASQVQETSQAATTSTPVEIDQDQIKRWVRQAGEAAKEGDRDAAAGFFDQALAMLRDGQGPEKTRIKLTEKRVLLQADSALCLEGAALCEASGDLDMAGRFLEIAIRHDPLDLPCLQMDVEIARRMSAPHRLLMALMKLSDGYEKSGDLVSYDRLQREIRTLRDAG
ncbi:MAG: hypothetical protein H6728_02325 [Myxococcales bacterium]|nr:hypothetical protein [Myxococcales bacterium]MCB9641890.1 hypothetical protein [Myxococcales bacterium]